MLGTGDSGTKAERTAILVIHGVGQQNPYETLDSFAGGLARYFREQRQANPTIRPERIAHEGWTEAAIHFEFEKPVGERGLRQLSLFEYYWAPYTQDKVTFRESLKFLIKADLTPLRYFAANVQTMYGAGRKTLGQVLWIFMREIARMVLFFVPVLLLLGLAYATLPETSDALEALKEYREAFQAALGWPLFWFFICVVIAAAMVRVVWQMIKKRAWSEGVNIQGRAEVLWRFLEIAALAGFSIAAWAIASQSEKVAALVSELTENYAAAKILAAVVLAAWFRGVLVDYVGDLAVYVSADKKSKGYEARAKILDESSEALKRLLGDKARNYNQVIVAGHSLGSVIAYDTINEVLSQVWSSPDQLRQGPKTKIVVEDLEKLKGLVTFGSPLDKTYYFFREQVSDRQAYRAQILSFLHSFRKVRSGRTYGEDEFKYRQGNGPDERPSTFPQLAGFTWLNVYSPMDPVSGYLNFYQMGTGTQLRLWYWIPLAAHLKYWGDGKFYKFFGDWLL